MPGCNARHCRWRTMARPDWRGVEDKLGEVWETLLAKSGTQDWRGVERPVGKEWKDWRAGNTIAAELMSGFENTKGHSLKSRFDVMRVGERS